MASLVEGKRVAIIGCGVMGQSIMAGFVASGLVPWSSIRVTTVPEMASDLQQQFPEIGVSTDNAELIDKADIVLFWYAQAGPQGAHGGL